MVLIKNSDIWYSWDKYQIRYCRSEFDGAYMWEVQYKDFGSLYECSTVNQALEWIKGQWP